MKLLNAKTFAMITALSMAPQTLAFDVFFAQNNVRNDRYIRVSKTTDSRGKSITQYQTCDIGDVKFEACKDLGKFYDDPLRQRASCLVQAASDASGITEWIAIGGGIVLGAGAAIAGGIISTPALPILGTVAGAWAGGVAGVATAEALAMTHAVKRTQRIQERASTVSNYVIEDNDFTMTDMTPEKFEARLRQATASTNCSPPVASVTSTGIRASTLTEADLKTRERRDNTTAMMPHAASFARTPVAKAGN